MDAAIKIKKYPEVADMKPITVLMVHQCFHITALRELLQLLSHCCGDPFLVSDRQLAQLSGSPDVPFNPVHASLQNNGSFP